MYSQAIHLLINHTLQAPILHFSLGLSGSAGLSGQILKKASKRRSYLYAKEGQRARRDGGQTHTSHYRNIMVHVDAGGTDTPAISIHVATEGPPDTASRQSHPNAYRLSFL